MSFELEKKKRVLVTGGAGFLGSHLCEALLNSGCIVICLDNLSTGDLKNVKHLFQNPNFEWIKHDVIFPIKLEIDEIYNLACPASPINYQFDPIQTTKTCVLGALNMLDIAKQCGAKILQASTSEIYGDPTVHPQHEQYWGNVNPIGPRSCYDEGKRCAETLFFDYWRQYGVRVKVARIFNTYGPNMHPNDGRVVSNFIVQALKNEPITIYGNGLQTRSFCYVTDLVEGLIRLMNSAVEVTGPINLGNPNEFTIKQLASAIIKTTFSKSILELKALPIDDPRQRKPDIRLANELLNWAPSIELTLGLQKSVNYFDQLLKNRELT